MLPYVLLTQQLIPKMQARDARSGILNVASLGALPPGILFEPVYAGTKAFEASLTKGILYEVDKKIDVMCLRPGLVATKMSRVEKADGALGAEEVARGALKSMGWDKVAEGHWSHAMQHFLIELTIKSLPQWA